MKVGGTGLSFGVALGRAVHGPIADGRDLLFGQPAFIQEIAVAGSRFPRRHHAGLRDGRDLLGALGGVLIGQQRERRHLARAMAVGAVLIEDRRDVAIESGRGAGLYGACIGHSGKSQDQ